MASFRTVMRCVALLLFLALPALGHPDVVVVLGCQNDAELAARVAVAARVIAAAGARHPPLVVLSGGARYRGSTEAGVMAARLAPRLHGRAVALVEETESLDTVGNALFTAYALSDRRPGALTVVTSDFHAERARAYFERVLPPGWRVTTAGASPAPRSGVEVARRLSHERASLARSFAEMFDAPPPIPRGGLDRLLARLVERHPYYRGRRDLLLRHRIVRDGQLTAPATVRN